MRSYGPVRRQDYYDTYAIMYAWYYTCCIQQNCQMHFIARSQIHSEVHSWLHSIIHTQPAWLTLPSKLSSRSKLHSMAHSQPAWLYAPKSALKTLPCTPSSRSQVHFPARFQVSSQLHSMVHSQSTLLYTPKFTLKREDTPNLTWLYAPMYAPGYSIQRLA
jgi:hypothetical protein